ncbi:MAG: CBS domain-containing protein [archaeon]|nr:CBS domain-containing protein [archaeon]
MLEPSMLHKARITIGITQKKLAVESGVSQSLIAKIEAGILDPTFSRMKKIDNAISQLSTNSEKTASQIMNKKVIFSKKNSLILSIIKIMTTHSISQIPIIDSQVVIGLVTESAILEASSRNDFKRIEAGYIMSDAPPLVNEKTPLSSIRELLRHDPIVLVLNNGKIVGVITKADILGEKIYSRF